MVGAQQCYAFIQSEIASFQFLCEQLSHNMPIMEVTRVFLLSMYLFVAVNCSPNPGYTHHIHYRIHVPQKIKTIHHTKIVKVPEHHHYFHEKEKIIQVEVAKHDPVYPPLREEDVGEFSGLFDSGDHSFGESRQNPQKIETPIRPKKHIKRKVVQRSD